MTAAMPANGSSNSGVGSEWNTDAVVSPYVQMKEVLPLSESISVANENYSSEYYPCRTRFLCKRPRNWSWESEQNVLIQRIWR